MRSANSYGEQSNTKASKVELLRHFISDNKMTSEHSKRSEGRRLTPGLGQPRLINNTCLETSNLCYVNCVIQLLSQSGIKEFIQHELPGLLVNARPQDYPTARALFSLYKEGEEEKSAAKSRR